MNDRGVWRGFLSRLAALLGALPAGLGTLQQRDIRAFFAFLSTGLADQGGQSAQFGKKMRAPAQKRGTGPTEPCGVQTKPHETGKISSKLIGEIFTNLRAVDASPNAFFIVIMCHNVFLKRLTPS